MSAERVTIDEKLNAEYAKIAAQGTQFLGLTILEYRSQLIKLVRRTASTDLLDYGSGQGQAWKRLARELGVNVCQYEPSIPRLARKPKRTFHGVVCVDVLEHVPERLVDAVIEDLFFYAQRFLLVTTCPRPAKKFFSDGVTNMHVTQKPASWWLDKLEAANRDGIILLHKETP